MKTQSIAKLPKKLSKRLTPGLFRWWLGRKCEACEGTGRTKDNWKKCPICRGCGRKGVLAKLYNWWMLDTPLALPSRHFTNEPGEYTWEDWVRETKNKTPVRFYLQKDLPRHFKRKFVWPLEKAYRWVRYRTTDRYHIIDISDKRHHYWRGWIDRDHALLLAVFKIFCDYMEQESQYVGWEASEHHAAAKKEMDQLYHWWTVERVKEYDSTDYSWEHEEEVRKKEDEMLKKVIDLRGYFWS